MNFIFNSNMLFGIIFIALSIGLYVSTCLNRYKKTNFKGKTAIITTSIVIACIGLLFLIAGIVYAWPQMIA